MAKWRDEKRRYRQYKARKEQLPASHHEAIDAVERYAVRFGPGTGDTLVPMLEDLVETFEQSAADGTSVGEVVGDDPVEFAETFLRRYPAGPWVAREQQRLSHAVARATASDATLKR
jgi:DNA-binding ferritin-like protein (Dps family)